MKRNNWSSGLQFFYCIYFEKLWKRFKWALKYRLNIHDYVLRAFIIFTVLNLWYNYYQTRRDSRFMICFKIDKILCVSEVRSVRWYWKVFSNLRQKYSRLKSMSKWQVLPKLLLFVISGVINWIIGITLEHRSFKYKIKL